jgi:hypothetical protein
MDTMNHDGHNENYLELKSSHCFLCENLVPFVFLNL